MIQDEDFRFGCNLLDRRRQEIHNVDENSNLVNVKNSLGKRLINAMRFYKSNENC